jgi:hypothetical protein
MEKEEGRQRECDTPSSHKLPPQVHCVDGQDKPYQTIPTSTIMRHGAGRSVGRRSLTWPKTLIRSKSWMDKAAERDPIEEDLFRPFSCASKLLRIFYRRKERERDRGKQREAGRGRERETVRDRDRERGQVRQK